VVVDEEHKFGVKQKEKLKALKLIFAHFINECNPNPKKFKYGTKLYKVVFDSTYSPS